MEINTWVIANVVIAIILLIAIYKIGYMFGKKDGIAFGIDVTREFISIVLVNVFKDFPEAIDIMNDYAKKHADELTFEVNEKLEKECGTKK